jgi:hypothetical protein
VFPDPFAKHLVQQLTKNTQELVRTVDDIDNEERDADEDNFR